MNQLTLIATCAFGLESVVRNELKTLGFSPRITDAGKIMFTGTMEDVFRTNLWLRTADRVLILIQEFKADNFDDLFETTKSIAWEEWIPIDGRFPVVGRSRNSTLTSVPAIQRSVKRAIVDRLRTAFSQPDSMTFEESGPLYRVEIALLNDQAMLTIDTTGPSLHKRGYRRFIGAAPLKETLAAALVQLSFWNRERPLLDPFCGTGTIPIEAALIGRNMAPGRLRPFAFEQWPNVDQQMCADLRSDAERAILPQLPQTILATDVDAEALKMARFHAKQAGVETDIHFQQKSFAQTSSKRRYGCVITNPPYGERISDVEEVQSLYQTIPEVLRRLPTWSHFILTGFTGFESVVQKKADRRRKLYNGRLECTYYQFHGPKPMTDQSSADSRSESSYSATGNFSAEEPESAVRHAKVSVVTKTASHVGTVERKIQAPVFGGLTAKAEEQAELFAARLIKRARHFRRWPTRRDIHCFRLYDRDVPEIPLTVDRYEDHLHITEYERPHERDLAQHAEWLDLMVRTAADALDVPRKQVFLKSRQRQKGTLQHDRVANESYEIEVREGGLRFLVNLSDYVDTGLFLDHRTTRSMVRDMAKGSRVLNLFAYTGAFSVYAADAPAASVTTVDWSATYLDWARRNLQLNGFTGPSFSFVRKDALEFVRSLPPEELFDLVIIDPPTFSNSKRTTNDWIIQRDHPALLTETMLRLSVGGTIVFSTNFRRFKLADSEFPAGSIREISRQTVPEDFRNRRIHRCWLITKT